MTGRIVFLLAIAAATLLPGAACASALDDWVDDDLLPAVDETLTTHARFKGESVRFVVFDDDAPAAASNALAVALRDRLAAAAVASGGIRIASSGNGVLPGQAIDCARADADYLVGVEVSRDIGNAASVVVRALDVRENAWVSGFVFDWHGRLDRGELLAMAAPAVDESRRGARAVPFDAHESDLLARHLAWDIACQSLRETNGDYIVDTATLASETGDPQWQRILELARQHIAAHSAIGLTADGEQTTAKLVGKAHAIGNGLYQYWLTILPADAGADLDTLSASAYVRVGPERAMADQPATSVRDALAVPGARNDRVLGPLSVAHGANGDLLRTTARADAIVFSIQFKPGLGMMRLGDRNCNPRTIARIVRAGEQLALPVADRRTGSRDATEILQWRIVPTRNTYFTIAISDSRLARRVASHVDRLPLNCGSSIPAGLRDAALLDWLDRFVELTDDGARHVAWRAIEIRDVL